MVVLAKSAWFPFLLQIKEGGAMGLLLALEWMEQLGMTHVIFEMDSKVVIDNLLHSCDEICEYGSIIQHCCDQCF